MTYRIPLSPVAISEYLGQIEALKRGFDLLRDHVVITDENANILYANRAAERNTGFSLKEMIGKNPADLWGGKMPREFYEKMWRTIKNEKQPFVAEVEKEYGSYPIITARPSPKNCGRASFQRFPARQAKASGCLS